MQNNSDPYYWREDADTIAKSENSWLVKLARIHRAPVNFLFWKINDFYFLKKFKAGETLFSLFWDLTEDHLTVKWSPENYRIKKKLE